MRILDWRSQAKLNDLTIFTEETHLVCREKVGLLSASVSSSSSPSDPVSKSRLARLDPKSTGFRFAEEEQGPEELSVL